MRLEIIRDDTICPGAERRYRTPGLITWVVSAAGVTEEGAWAFEACTNWMIDQLGWDEQVDLDAAYTYEQGDLPDDVPVEMTFEDGRLHCLLHPAHFCLATINSALVELREQLDGRAVANAR